MTTLPRIKCEGQVYSAELVRMVACKNDAAHVVFTSGRPQTFCYACTSRLRGFAERMGVKIDSIPIKDIPANNTRWGR